jgi:hypothetical protein
MAAMLRQEPGFNPNSLRNLTGIFSGGAPHAPDAIRAFTANQIPLANGYGMTEAAGTVCCMPLDLAEIEQNISASGLIPPDVQVRIVDGSETDVPPGAAGEILVRGRNVSAGYWRRPQETAAAFTTDGWYRSSPAAKTSTPRKSKPPSPTTPASPIAPSSASPMNAGAKPATWSPPPATATTSTPTSSSPICNPAWPATKSPNTSRSCRPCPATAPANSSRRSCVSW